MSWDETNVQDMTEMVTGMTLPSLSWAKVREAMFADGGPVATALPAEEWQVFPGEWSATPIGGEAWQPFGVTYSMSVKVGRRPGFIEKVFQTVFPQRRVEGVDTAMDPVSKLMEMGFEIFAQETLKNTMRNAEKEGATPEMTAQYVARIQATGTLSADVYLLGAGNLTDLLAINRINYLLHWRQSETYNAKGVLKFSDSSSWTVAANESFDGFDFTEWYSAVAGRLAFRFDASL